VGAKWGAKKCPGRVFFFVSNTRRLFGNFAMADFRQIWPWHMNRGWNTEFGQKFMKSFHSGVICPQNPKLWGGQTGTSLRAGYKSRDTLQRDTVFIPRCSPRAREFAISVNFSVRRTVAELRGLPIFGFWPIFPYKTLWPAYIAEWFRFFRVVVKGPKGCLPAAVFSYDFR